MNPTCSSAAFRAVPKELPLLIVSGADDPVGDYGKGVKTVNGTGNLYVTVEIEVPTRLTRDQEKKVAESEDNIALKSCDNMSRFANTVSAVYGKTLGKQ